MGWVCLFVLELMATQLPWQQLQCSRCNWGRRYTGLHRVELCHCAEWMGNTWGEALQGQQLFMVV